MSNFAKYENLQALFTAIGKKKLSVSDTMPTAVAAYEDICILYIGPTDANYTKGYVYECEEVTPSTNPKTYSWNAKINVDVDLSKYKTIFLGTSDEWDLLTDAQRSEYDCAAFTDDNENYTTISNVVAEGDMHPVTSNAVYERAEETEDEISDIVNVYGAKNLIPFDLENIIEINTDGTWNKNVFTKNGVVWTVNSDGTVSASGAVTTGLSASSIKLFLSDANLPFINKSVIISGCPDGGKVNDTVYHKVMGYRVLSTSGSTGTVDVFDSNDSNSFIWKNDGSGTKANISLAIYEAAGTVDLLFKPMLRMSKVKDNTFEPYVKTNKQLTEDSVSWDDLSEFGAVNLLDNILSTTTKNGLTATVNSDKSVTVTADSYPFTVATSTYFNVQTVTPTGVYKLSGCPNTGDSKIHIYVRDNNDGYITDYGDGAVGNFKGTGCNISFLSGAVVTKALTFYPMITDPSYNGPYVPYIMTNKELTERYVISVITIPNVSYTADTEYYPVKEHHLGLQKAYFYYMGKEKETPL